MHPILLQLGPLKLRAYGLALAVSFLLGSWLALKRGRRQGMKEDDLLGLFWWIIIASVVGARLHYVIAHPDQFQNILDAFRIWDGGLILYGGLILGIAAAWVYLRRKRLAFLPVADVVAPALALGEGITRIGCFFNGCCFGDACHGNGVLCITYPPTSYAAQALGPGVAVWPSQLMLSVGLLISLFIILRTDRYLRAPGAIFGLYLVLQGIARYLIDFTRYYEPEDRLHLGLFWLTTKSQVIALILLAAGIVLVARGIRGRAAGRISEAA